MSADGRKEGNIFVVYADMNISKKRVIYLRNEEGTRMPLTDRELLARLIRCEAGGEGDNGMKAVASVVMNRVHIPYGEYARVGQGSIRNIIFQPGQFVCASDMEEGKYLSLIHI